MILVEATGSFARWMKNSKLNIATVSPWEQDTQSFLKESNKVSPGWLLDYLYCVKCRSRAISILLQQCLEMSRTGTYWLGHCEKTNRQKGGNRVIRAYSDLSNVSMKVRAEKVMWNLWCSPLSYSIDTSASVPQWCPMTPLCYVLYIQWTKRGSLPQLSF